MLKLDQVTFLIAVLTARNVQGAPIVTVGVEHGELAGATLRTLKTMQEKLSVTGRATDAPPA